MIVLGVVFMAQRRSKGRASSSVSFFSDSVSKRIALTGRRRSAVIVLACCFLFAVVGITFVLLRQGEYRLTRSSGPGAAAEADARQGAHESEPVDRGEPSDSEGSSKASDSTETFFVHVDGAVASPGVYELAAGSRANDAVRAAGGPTEGADLSMLNLAQKVSDGEKIHVPAQGEAAPQPSQADVGSTDPSVPPSGSGSSKGGASLVNINTASVDELKTLSGVGESTAKAIVEDRTNNGPFASKEDLMRVSGIGEKKYAKLEGSICV